MNFSEHRKTILKNSQNVLTETQFGDFAKYDFIPSDLDTIENQIAHLKDNVNEAGWHIGKRLTEIRDKFLDRTGYRNIHEYAFHKYGFGKTTTYNLIFAATKFSRVQALELGSKVYLLKSLDEHQQKECLEWIKNENPTYRNIEERIKTRNKPDVSPPKKSISFFRGNIQIDIKSIGINNVSKKQEEELLAEIEAFVSNWVKRYLDIDNEGEQM